MDDQLRLVYRCLDADLSDNALFLASVLHVLDPENGTWAHLKSLACLRLGQYGLARQYSCENGLTGEHLGCSYVFALASLSQGNYLEGISALERAKPHWQLRNRDASAPLAPDPLTQRFWPDRPAVNCLLAKLHRYNKDNKNAAIHFTEALELDPLMWDALTNLCDIVRDRQKPAATATARPGPAHKRTLPQRKAAVSPTPTPETDPSTKLESIRVEAIAERERTVRLLGIFQSLGVAYQSLSKYEPRACLDAFGSLPIELQATPWVLSKSARAQYELMDYKKAKQTFQALRKRAPSWIEDLEVYSTVLWHLKDEVPLSLLAHELTESHFQSPETWCAVGNSFSVCRSRDEAIRCFRRACQLSPQLPQTYSLLGYELMEQEDYYEAIGAFQRAIRVEPRFYTAWVGLGRAYERLSRNDVALKHYLTAVEINSSNPIIYTYVARVLETLQKRRSAIEYLRRGIRLSPPPLTMALIRMQRAGIYLYAGQPGAALEDLRAVALIAPDEPRVHLLLGQAYAMQGEDKAAALKSYTTALSLAPWSREIKDAMLSLEDE
ncbi:unnamed protein product [Clonostachys rosea f. rosea IK726]|uniref:Uncharacterized protein n=1 Tax=Clonostachys rosea f. rosea IK726 TaxID=1349383 RepID=A0ACA9U973_BIOOC|nr:unnamed protein product [Clonostachys rosea f. rosea IK726]